MAYGIPERAVMIALMALNKETLNSELKNRYRLDLRKPARDKLNRDGLVQSRRLEGGRGYAHELTDAGWVWVVAELEEKAPDRAGSAGGALYALLNGLKAALDARGMLIQELFAATSSAVPQPSGSLRDRIREAYRNLASRPWDWVELRDLRAQLGDWPRRDVDPELIRMFRAKEVNLTLHEDRGRLTQADRDAALRLGVDDMHLISME
ncbi:MAG: hypothetical protein OXH69_17760 [Acidobacteria bacterium]|nr:hypothetical protein [Acidobacteriota bacterium]